MRRALQSEDPCEAAGEEREAAVPQQEELVAALLVRDRQSPAPWEQVA